MFFECLLLRDIDQLCDCICKFTCLKLIAYFSKFEEFNDFKEQSACCKG